MKLVNETKINKAEETTTLGVKVGDTTLGVSLTQPRKMNWLIANPDSTLVRRVKYDKESQLLRVKFHNEREYEYSDVPFMVYKDLIHAESVGGFFNKSVKGFFDFTEL